MVDKVDPALAWRSKAPGAGEARPINLGDYTAFDLDNGLKVIVVENHKLPRVSYQLTLNNDPISEGDQVGYVSTAGTLLATGTKNRTKAEIDASIDFIGASINTFGSGMFASSLTKHEGKLLELMTDILYNPTFPQEEFDKLKTQALSGLANVKTNANAMAGNVAAVVNYGADHPYGEIQTEADVQNMSLAKCKEYFNTYFKPNNAYLVVVGDVNPEDAKTTAMKYFGKWKPGVIPESTYPTPTKPDGTHVSFVNKDGAVQSVIRVTYPVDLKPGTDDIVKARVMNSVLGGGVFSGRLMQNLREDKAYTYGARSSLSSNELIGNFNASASVRNEVTDSSVTQFIYEMQRLRDEPVDQEDVDLVKNSITGSFARSLESPQTIAGFARSIYKFGLPKDYYETYLQRLNAVTVADVQEMARKYIRPENAHIVISGSKDDVADKLAQFDADGEIDFYDAFGAKLEMMDDALPEGVDAKTVISDYLDAIGGATKLNGVKSIISEFSMNIMGQEASTIMGQLDNSKYFMEMSMSGNVLQEQRFDGMKGSVGGMGQPSQVLTEGKELNEMKKSARHFAQQSYLTDEYTLTLKGLEDVSGEKAYKIEVMDADDNKTYEFYSVKTNLLIKSSMTQTGPDGNPATIETTLGDYKESGGIIFPNKMTITGAAPFPLEMVAKSIEVNGTVPTDKFMVK